MSEHQRSTIIKWVKSESFSTIRYRYWVLKPAITPPLPRCNTSGTPTKIRNWAALALKDRGDRRGGMVVTGALLGISGLCWTTKASRNSLSDLTTNEFNKHKPTSNCARRFTAGKNHFFSRLIPIQIGFCVWSAIRITLPTWISGSYLSWLAHIFFLREAIKPKSFDKIYNRNRSCKFNRMFFILNHSHMYVIPFGRLPARPVKIKMCLQLPTKILHLWPLQGSSPNQPWACWASTLEMKLNVRIKGW